MPWEASESTLVIMLMAMGLSPLAVIGLILVGSKVVKRSERSE